MLYRRIVVLFTLLFLLATSVSGTVPNSDAVLQSACAKMKLHDYRGAMVALQDIPHGGERDFIAGLAAYRLKQWEDAAVAFARSAPAYPLLADYARYYQAKALEQLKRPAEMIAPLSTLLANTPDSPLARQSLSMLGSAHFQRQAWTESHATYQRYINKYPAGAEALEASYRSALCKEKLGDPAAAVQILHRLWLSSPGSTYAEKAETELKRLQSSGQHVPTPTSDELYRRAVALYDLKKYDATLKALQSIPLSGSSDEFTSKVLFKTGQTLFRAKRYQEAELTFSGLLPKIKGQRAEAWYWLARSLDRSGKDPDALAAYLKLSEQYGTSDLADDALFQAAMLYDDFGNWSEAAKLLERLLATFPKSDMRQQAEWILAWGCYRAGDTVKAVEKLKRLAEADPYRDRALYWLARALEKSGDTAAAMTTATQLLEEYPYGYYAQTWRSAKGLTPPVLPAVSPELASLLPWPAGFEREKALIAIGLVDEARSELTKHRAKLPRGTTAAGLARLHLEINDYNGAYHLLKKRPRKLGKDPLLAWAISYPAAFRETVLKESSKNGLPPELVYGIMRTESTFSPTVVSPAGAIGLMQLMPATAAQMTGGTHGSATLKQPEHNIKLGTRHMRDLITMYKGEQVFAIAAYNAGSHNVDRWRKAIGQVPGEEFIERIPFAETREYVKKVLSAAAIYRQLYPMQQVAMTKFPIFSDFSSLNAD